MPRSSAHTAPRTHRFLALLWPALALAACAALWCSAVTRSDAERDRAAGAAFKEADAYAEAYEQYVTRSVAQVDQISMQLKHSWEHGHDRSLIEDMRRDGMFTDGAFVDVSVVGRDGAVRSSSRAHARMGNLAQAAFFVEHRDNISTALRIDAAPPALDARGAILFTRRLDTDDDAFDGVLVVAVDAGYFTSFVSTRTLGADSLLALVGTDHPLRVEQDASGAGTQAGSLLPADVDRWPAARGVRLIEGGAGAGGFADGRARVLGWRRSSGYPLVVLVALSRAAALAGAAAYWEDSRNRALLATFGLLAVAGAASLLSLRAARRARERGEVQRAYRTATEAGNDGFYMVAPLHDRKDRIVDFRIVDCNERGAFFYGSTRAALVGTLVSQVGGVDGAALIADYRQAMAAGFHQEDRRMPDDNRLNIRWGRRRIVRVGDGLAVTLQDISERKAHEAELARLANEDSLTGLPNRHWFLHFVPPALETARADGHGAALLFIDLDDFKQVNDSHGHAAGDRLLRAAAERLLSQLRPGDHVARFGGDEFIVLLSPFDNEQQIAAVASRIIDAFGKPFSIGGDQHAIGASVGISVFPRDGQDAATLIRHSDIAMYAGKNEGKGQVRFFDPAQSSMLKTRAQLRQRLLAAIDERQFVLHYQPRVDTRSGELLSMEALLRWQHPQLGMIRPDEFIPLAESSGLIVPIGAIVVDEACAQLAAWRDAGLSTVPVSINVSPKQFLRGGVQRELADALARHDVAPGLLEVEITESAMMGDQDAILAELAAIRALGIKLHVDDFGTGYSSLSQLQRMKMDVLKVDRSFTAALGRSREGTVFFQAIVSMAHALGMDVVAEGVETREQLALLRALGCNEVQGYLIARPMPAQAMAALLAKRFLFEDELAA